MYHDPGLRRMVVLRAANQKQLIAGGNHTIIPSADCRRYTRFVQRYTPMQRRCPSDMTSEELKYYLEVSTRIQKKLVDLF